MKTTKLRHVFDWICIFLGHLKKGSLFPVSLIPRCIEGWPLTSPDPVLVHWVGREMTGCFMDSILFSQQGVIVFLGEITTRHMSWSDCPVYMFGEEIFFFFLHFAIIIRIAYFINWLILHINEPADVPVTISSSICCRKRTKNVHHYTERQIWVNTMSCSHCVDFTLTIINAAN